MASTEMMFRELEEQVQAYIARIEELSADRYVLMQCWFSATEKLKELGYKPNMSSDGLTVKEWRRIEQEQLPVQ